MTTRSCVRSAVHQATCNLEASMGVGAQMGFYAANWMDLRATPTAEWQGATLCGEEARAAWRGAQRGKTKRKRRKR